MEDVGSCGGKKSSSSSAGQRRSELQCDTLSISKLSSVCRKCRELGTMGCRCGLRHCVHCKRPDHETCVLIWSERLKAVASAVAIPHPVVHCPARCVQDTTAGILQHCELHRRLRRSQPLGRRVDSAHDLPHIPGPGAAAVGVVDQCPGTRREVARQTELCSAQAEAWHGTTLAWTLTRSFHLWSKSVQQRAIVVACSK